MKTLLKVMFCAACLLAGTASAAVSRDDASTLAQKKTNGGRVMSVEKFVEGDKNVWRVKVLTSSGEVRAVFVDEATGKVY
ncbi:MAG: PepSY domain-containing protein [Deefgea sp.]